MEDKAPLIVIEATDLTEFANKCTAAISEGYRISSTHCSFVDSAEYNFCSSYQAILVLPFAVVGGLEAVLETSPKIPPHDHVSVLRRVR